MVSWASFALEQISLRLLNLLTGGSYHELGIIPHGYDRHPLTHQACLTTMYQINYPSPSSATLKTSRQAAIADYHQPNRLLSVQTGLRRVFQQILTAHPHERSVDYADLPARTWCATHKRTPFVANAPGESRDLHQARVIPFSELQQVPTQRTLKTEVPN